LREAYFIFFDKIDSEIQKHILDDKNQSDTLEIIVFRRQGTHRLAGRIGLHVAYLPHVCL